MCLSGCQGDDAEKNVPQAESKDPVVSGLSQKSLELTATTSHGRFQSFLAQYPVPSAIHLLICNTTIRVQTPDILWQQESDDQLHQQNSKKFPDFCRQWFPLVSSSPET